MQETIANSKFEEIRKEQRELYKRESLGISLEEFRNAGMQPDDRALAEKTLNSVAEVYGIRLDAVVWPGGRITSSKAISVYAGSGNDAKSAFEAYDSQTLFMKEYADSIVKLDIGSNETHSDFGIAVIGSGKRSVALIEINAEANAHASVTILGLSGSAGRSLSGIYSIMRAGKSANVEVNYIFNQKGNTDIIGTANAFAGENSKININCLYVGGNAARIENVLSLDGNYASGAIRETAYLTGTQRLDSTSSIINYGSNTEGLSDSKVVAEGNATAIMKGYARVEKGAIGAVSHVKEKGITMNKSTRIEALPMMVINEKNVKEAKHSAGVAPFSEDALFYMCARGIDQNTARNLIIKSILASNLSGIEGNAARIVMPSMLFGKVELGKIGEVALHNISGVWF